MRKEQATYMKTEAAALIVARFLILSVICSDSVIKDDQDDDSLVAGLELSLRSDDNRYEIFLHHFSLRSMDILTYYSRDEERIKMNSEMKL